VSVRSSTCWLLVALLLAFSGYELRGMRRDYKDWREAEKIGDRSAADFYFTNLEWSGGLILVGWAMGAGALFALRPKRTSRE
jgi:hypothetical protein